MITTLAYGGITHHYVAQKANFCNLVNSKGTIHNEYKILMLGNKKTRAGIIQGTDSACGRIYGLIGSYSIMENLELMYGGYNANFKEFHERGLKPVEINGVTPVLGLDFRLPVYKTEGLKLSIDTLVSIGIVTHSLRVDF